MVAIAMGTVCPVCVAVMVAGMIARLPAAAVQAPAIAALTPFRTLVIMTRAHALPMALSPPVFMAPHVPVTGRPFISPARRRNNFVSRRRRSIANDDTDTHLRDCLSRNKSRHTENKGCGSTKNTFHLISKRSCVQSSIRNCRGETISDASAYKIVSRMTLPCPSTRIELRATSAACRPSRTT